MLSGVLTRSTAENGSLRSCSSDTAHMRLWSRCGTLDSCCCCPRARAKTVPQRSTYLVAASSHVCRRPGAAEADGGTRRSKGHRRGTGVGPPAAGRPLRLLIKRGAVAQSGAGRAQWPQVRSPSATASQCARTGGHKAACSVFFVCFMMLLGVRGLRTCVGRSRPTS